jgi:hypothetical protein
MISFKKNVCKVFFRSLNNYVLFFLNFDLFFSQAVGKTKQNVTRNSISGTP